jgi:hypothetical protein
MSPAYTPGKLVLAQTYIGIDDPDAAAYIAAVELADQQSLETATKVAIHSFIKGCKRDGIWPAIKACCILAGARTLAGALVPLVGTAPTNNGPFVSGDYDRKTGLVGDGSTKYLNSNRASNADGLDNNHTAVRLTNSLANNQGLSGTVGGGAGYSGIGRFGPTYFWSRSNNNTVGAAAGTNAAGFSDAGLYGFSRVDSSGITWKAGTVAVTAVALARNSANSGNTIFFNGGNNDNYTTSRIAFYSIGESLNLAQLDTRVTALINALAVAIP